METGHHIHRLLKPEVRYWQEVLHWTLYSIVTTTKHRGSVHTLVLVQQLVPTQNVNTQMESQRNRMKQLKKESTRPLCSQLCAMRHRPLSSFLTESATLYPGMLFSIPTTKHGIRRRHSPPEDFVVFLTDQRE